MQRTALRAAADARRYVHILRGHMEAKLADIGDLRRSTRGRISGYVQDGEDLLIQALDGTIYRLQNASAKQGPFVTIVASGDRKVAVGDIRQAAVASGTLRLLLSFALVFASVLGLLTRNQSRMLVDSRELGPQLEQLQRLRKSLAGMERFVATQENRVTAVADTLTAMKAEKNRLEQVLALTRDQVTALLEAQKEIAARHRLRELLISFGCGVVSSLVATGIWQLTVGRKRRGIQVAEVTAGT
ncbi:MAG: hypothetical protein U0527_01130 [Candidatus Eisenbacteria bacterium]